jgi:hypothetical protein
MKCFESNNGEDSAVKKKKQGKWRLCYQNTRFDSTENKDKRNRIEISKALNVLERLVWNWYV